MRRAFCVVSDFPPLRQRAVVVGFALRKTPCIDAHLEHVCVIKMKARRSEVGADFLKCGGDVFTTRVL
jgi:hypothetical protein